MVENAILFITKDSEPLLFDGTAFTPFPLKKNKDYFSAGLVPAPLVRTHGFRVEKGIARITSYNVCYTKLLRFKQCCAIHRYLASPGRYDETGRICQDLC